MIQLFIFQIKEIPCGAEGDGMNALKAGLLFIVLVQAISAPVYASENDNPIQIENITSISSMVNPATLNLARSVNAAPEWRNFIPPQAFWSPGGSKLLVRSSIRWYRDDVNFRPGNRNGIDAMYTLDADGTNLTKIVSNEINNRSTPIELPAPLGNNPWSSSGDTVVIDNGAFYILADTGGNWLNVPGTNFSDMVSIVTNLSKIPRQRNFAWSPDGTRAVYTILDIEKSERKYIVKSEKLYIANADGSDIKQLASEVNESILGSISWSHDGKQIAFSGKNLWIVNSDGTNLRQPGACRGSTWSPDDSKFLCMSSE